MWEDQRKKWCYIVHIAPQGVNSAILFIYRTGCVYGNEPGGFQKVFSALSALDKTVNGYNKTSLVQIRCNLSSKSANLVCLMVASEC